MEEKFENIKNMHKILFLEFENCHRIFVQTHVDHGKFFISDNVRIYYVLGGSVEIRDHKGSFVLEAGDMYIARPGQAHWSYKLGQELIVVVFEIFIQYLSKNFRIDKNRIIGGRIEDEELKYKLSFLLRVFLKERLSSSYQDVDIWKYIGDLIQLIDSDSPREESEKNDIDSIIEDIALKTPYRIMDQEDLRLKNLAREYGVSYYYLSRSFKDYSNLSYKDYLLESQLNIFLHNLYTKPQESIANLALLSGYKSLSSFNKDFKSFFNITPRQMREALKSLIKLKEEIYKHPLVLEFLSQIVYMEDRYSQEGLVIDLRGSKYVGGEDLSFEDIIHKLEYIRSVLVGLRGQEVNIFLSQEDYLYIFNMYDWAVDDRFRQLNVDIMEICIENDISIISHIGKKPKNSHKITNIN